MNYDWTPTFAALDRAVAQFGQQNQYKDAIQSLLGSASPQFNNVQITPQVTPVDPGMSSESARRSATPINDPRRLAAYNQPIESMQYSGPLGQQLGYDQANGLGAMLKALPSGIGLPLLLNTMTNQMGQQQKIADARITPIADQEAQSMGLRPGGVYGRDVAGNIVTIQPSDMKSQGAIDQAIGLHNAEQVLTPEAFDQKVALAKAGRVNYGAQTAGNVQSVQPLNDGTLLIVKRDGTAQHVTADGQVVTGARFDPQTHFNMNAAGSAGNAAGVAAEALPATQANFDIINQTLDSFDDPRVKAQANHALGWQGKATFGASIPGITSDFNARYGQLDGQAFLNAFNSLKGGGQITEIEGSKATSAIARLQKAQTPDEFYSALNDARGTFKTIFTAAKQRASRGAVVPALKSQAPQSMQQSDPLGLRR